MPAEDSQSHDISPNTFSVSQLNRRVKSLLEIHLPLVWVEGEISNLSQPASGHWYFTLKDTSAQVKCAMFKRRSAYVKFKPRVGDNIKVRASVSLYEGRGDFQLIVEHMEPAGFGLLQKRFEELQQKLHSEGLFAQERKKALPKIPQHIAIITSPTGAAIHDALSVLERRFASIPVTIIPSAVQGDDAPEQLISALQYADKNENFDVILLTRGGGSIEDLWAFNSEKLARTIDQCSTPVISAVGHEVDVTIADFVADVRAPTPSVAAEIISPNKEEILAKLSRVEQRLVHNLTMRIQVNLNRLESVRKRLRHPREKLDNWAQRLDQLENRLGRAISQRKTNKSTQIFQLTERLRRANPQLRVEHHRQDLKDLERRLGLRMKGLLSTTRQRYHHAVDSLDMVSPLNTMKRGYSVAMNESDQVLRSIDDVSENETMRVILSDGTLISTVNKRVPD